MWDCGASDLNLIFCRVARRAITFSRCCTWSAGSVVVLICRVTSVPRTGSLDITLTDWAQAGLAKPSVARLDRLVTAEKTVLTRRLGSLSLSGQAIVRAAWNQHMRL